MTSLDRIGEIFQVNGTVKKVTPLQWHVPLQAPGLTFDEITASSLAKVNHRCSKIIRLAYPLNPAGFVIHGALVAQVLNAVDHAIRLRRHGISNTVGCFRLDGSRRSLNST